MTYRGCGSHSCIVEIHKGMGNNGPCRCADHRGKEEILRLRVEVDRLTRKIERLTHFDCCREKESLQLHVNQLEALLSFTERKNSL